MENQEVRHDVHEETTYERNERENDEAEEKEKIYFGDHVITPNGDEGQVTELDGEQYRVFNNMEVGWFTRDELTLVK